MNVRFGETYVVRGVKEFKRSHISKLHEAVSELRTSMPGSRGYCPTSDPQDVLVLTSGTLKDNLVDEGTNLYCTVLGLEKLGLLSIDKETAVARVGDFFKGKMFYPESVNIIDVSDNGDAI